MLTARLRVIIVLLTLLLLSSCPQPATKKSASEKLSEMELLLYLKNKGILDGGTNNPAQNFTGEYKGDYQLYGDLQEKDPDRYTTYFKVSPKESSGQSRITAEIYLPKGYLDRDYNDAVKHLPRMKFGGIIVHGTGKFLLKLSEQTGTAKTVQDEILKNLKVTDMRILGEAKEDKLGGKTLEDVKATGTKDDKTYKKTIATGRAIQ